MTPYFETVRSFADVPISDAGVDARAFFEATDGLVKLFDLFGSGVFGFIQADLRLNINGIKTDYEARPEQYATMEALVKAEKAEGHESALSCLIKLMRGLTLTYKALQHMEKDEKAELHVCFRRAYDDVLRQYHPWVVRTLVYIAIRSVPNRNDFYNKLAQGGPRDKLEAALHKWLCGLEEVVQHLTTFIHQGDYGRI